MSPTICTGWRPHPAAPTGFSGTPGVGLHILPHRPEISSRPVADSARCSSCRRNRRVCLCRPGVATNHRGIIRKRLRRNPLRICLGAAGPPPKSRYASDAFRPAAHAAQWLSFRPQNNAPEPVSCGRAQCWRSATLQCRGGAQWRSRRRSEAPSSSTCRAHRRRLRRKRPGLVA